MSELREKVLTISKDLKLAHVGSNLSAIDIIDEIYSIKKPSEKFVLSSGHAGIALYLVLEKYANVNAVDIYKKHGIHAVRCEECKIDCTTGSLGHGLPIAVGMALANKAKDVYCLTSDGEWMEGSMWEALRLARNLKLKNLKIYVNANSYGGMEFINPFQLQKQIKSFGFPVDFRITNTKPLGGLAAHYQQV